VYEVVDVVAREKTVVVTTPSGLILNNEAIDQSN
jgi:hypothetical protein